jgi:RNA polymerase sigma-70 factor, ECF subfamily
VLQGRFESPSRTLEPRTLRGLSPPRRDPPEARKGSCKFPKCLSQNRAELRLFLESVSGSSSLSDENVLSDSELVDLVRRGDLESFSALCRRYERSVLAVALAGLRDIHAAEDVVQTTLLAGFQRLSTLTNPSKFGPWILQIARRQVIESVRKRQMAVAVPGNDAIELATDDPPVPDWIDTEHLLNLIDRLPTRERVLIGLRFFDGHSLADIAEITTRPLGTVSKQLSRATTRLRAWLEKEDKQ